MVLLVTLLHFYSWVELKARNEGSEWIFLVPIDTFVKRIASEPKKSTHESWEVFLLETNNFHNEGLKVKYKSKNAC